MPNYTNTPTTTAEPVFTHSDFQTRENADTNVSKKSNTSGFATGLVVGGLVGAAAALLYAPKNGNEFRNDLRDSSIKLKERTQQMKDETMLKAKLGTMDAKDTVASLKEKSGNLSLSARQKLQEAKNTASEVKSETKAAIDEAKQENDNYQSNANTQTKAVVTPRTLSSTDTQQKTGTDSSYEKKQSDVNNRSI
ncbi:YtxH domain-containing protein [Fictibacillus phosphorivorans]|uniref:YtxH domain-containing protein n=1 Tax=Fictibacillus phosphorivorans TaxID=1221500 RepID=UPI0011A5F25D|nr:YtxH domain-containing protein [Fictibacillus phosphorivorans]